MKKAQVKFHSDGCGRKWSPAINIKVHNFITADKIQARFGCSDADAEQAGEFAFTSAQEDFWDSVQQQVKEVYGPDAKAYSEGRSGGWLVVEGIKDFADWRGGELAQWASLNRSVAETIACYTSEEWVFDMIEANDWAPHVETDAERATREASESAREADALAFENACFAI